MKRKFIVGLISSITALPTNQVSRNNRDVKLDKFYPGQDLEQNDIMEEDILHTYIFFFVWAISILIILWVIYYCISKNVDEGGRNVGGIGEAVPLVGDREEVETSRTSLAMIMIHR